MHHRKISLLGLSAALVLVMMPVEASARKGVSFGAVRTIGKFAERSSRSKDEKQTEPTAPMAASPFASSATASAEPVPVAVTAKLEPLAAAPNVGTVCIAGCYDAQGQSVRR